MFAEILGGIGAIGGLLGGGDDEVTRTNEPWSGVQPYLTGEGQVPWAGTPAMNLDWMRYNQDLAEGVNDSWLATPPPMLMNDPRLTGENVYQPQNPGGILGVDEWGSRRPPGESPVATVSGIIQPQQAAPQPQQAAPQPPAPAYNFVNDPSQTYAAPAQQPGYNWFDAWNDMHGGGGA